MYIGKEAMQEYLVKLKYCVKVIMILYKEAEWKGQVATDWLSMEIKLTLHVLN